MFCVIQEVMRKKPSPYGEYKELRAYQNKWRLDESKPFTWAWERTGGRFERPHLEAYKITIHQSYREGGAVKKRQYSICTMSYYEVCETWWGDCVCGGETAVADKLGIDPAELFDLIDSKLDPLRERLEAEWHQSPEYITKQEHERIIAEHMAAQTKFCRKYDVDESDYDRCYDVFGVLRNKEYLEQLKTAHKAKEQAYRSYQKTSHSTYGQYTSGGYSISSSSTYTGSERAMLKEFYRGLSKKYHPDLNPDRDTTAAMQLLNKLKGEWGI